MRAVIDTSVIVRAVLKDIPIVGPTEFLARFGQPL
jgi:hypothetical protein